MHAKGKPRLTVFVDDLTAIIEGDTAPFLVSKNSKSYEISAFVANVMDVAESGRNKDQFSIVFLGYETLGGLRVGDKVVVYAATSMPGGLRGGNIQFHGCKQK